MAGCHVGLGMLGYAFSLSVFHVPMLSLAIQHTIVPLEHILVGDLIYLLGVLFVLKKTPGLRKSGIEISVYISHVFIFVYTTLEVEGFGKLDLNSTYSKMFNDIMIWGQSLEKPSKSYVQRQLVPKLILEGSEMTFRTTEQEFRCV